MLFSDLIRSLSEKFPVININTCDTFDIKDTALLDGVQKHFQNDVLYLGYCEQIGSQKLPWHCVLVGTAAVSDLKCTDCDLALIEESNLFFLFNNVKAIVDASRSRGLYAELMDCAVQTKSVTAFANLAASKLGNSVVLVDTDYKILASSNIYPVSDPLWAQNIKQGYCCYDFITAVNELDSIKNAPNTSEPIVVTCYASPEKKLSSKVFHGGQMIGFVLMLEEDRPLSPTHFEMLPIISSAAGDLISRFAPHLLPGSTHYQRLLYDLLIGAPPEKLAKHIEKLSFSPHMCAVRLSQSRELGQKHLKEQSAEKLKSLFPGTQLTFHENGIAALFALGSAPSLSREQLSLLDDFARSEYLNIGLSNTFCRIEDFVPHYSQACRALRLNERTKGGESVCRYTDYAFFDLLGVTDKPEELCVFCHPALELLRKYDKENNTELFRTLEVYLACDRSIKLSSEKLFIHRNSLAYRLKRIYELTSLDTDDGNTRFLLDMSFRITHYIPVRP